MAWTAPAVLGQTASAADGTCTPKCIPAGTPRFTARARGVCNNRTYTVTVIPVLVPGSVGCPCGGTPVVGSSALVDTFRAGFRGTADITGTVSITCSDNAGDTCEVTCTLTVTVSITGNPGNDCARNNVTVLGVAPSC